MFWAGWAINEKMLIALLIGYVVLAGYSAYNRAGMPPLEFRAVRLPAERAAANMSQLPTDDAVS